ncbi:hypothetical protein ACJMK2_007489 [Sinanodonta woodiana]|uniref:Uncharacterized protein n=1 Tax=Sinanodonta woodiana TaxID=1069815 RepID=A0ABD3VIP8_SINWO
MSNPSIKRLMTIGKVWTIVGARRHINNVIGQRTDGGCWYGIENWHSMFDEIRQNTVHNIRHSMQIWHDMPNEIQQSMVMIFGTACKSGMICLMKFNRE